MKKEWTKAEVVVGLFAVAIAVIGIALTFFVPEVRKSIGLDKEVTDRLSPDHMAAPNHAETPTTTPAPLINETAVYWSDDAASGACKDFGAWTTVCSPDKPEGWTLVSHVFELTGDRAGCAYAECGPVSPPTATKVCYHFRTQGHDEECGHSGNTGIHYSRGKLTVVWAHH